MNPRKYAKLWKFGSRGENREGSWKNVKFVDLVKSFRRSIRWLNLVCYYCSNIIHRDPATAAENRPLKVWKWKTDVPLTSRVRGEVTNEVRSNAGVLNDTYGAIRYACSFGDIAPATALWAVVLSKDADELWTSDSPSKMTRWFLRFGCIFFGKIKFRAKSNLLTKCRSSRWTLANMRSFENSDHGEKTEKDHGRMWSL